MANVKKPTKKEMFAQLKAKYNLTEEEIKFIDHEIELLDKKKGGSGELTEAQKANKALGEKILEGLADGSKMTISAMIKNIDACEGLSTSKVSAVVRQLKDANLIIREEVKGVAYFYKAYPFGEALRSLPFPLRWLVQMTA